MPSWWLSCCKRMKVVLIAMILLWLTARLVYRRSRELEANKCADALARRGAVLSHDFVIFQSPPSDVSLLFSLDADGTTYKRKCSVFNVFS